MISEIQTWLTWTVEPLWIGVVEIELSLSYLMNLISALSNGADMHQTNYNLQFIYKLWTSENA